MSQRKHHRIRRCPIDDCEYNGGDLKRHLQSSKHRDDVNTETIDAMLQMANKGKQTKGRNRLLMRWCPVEECSFLTSRLRSHIKRKHGIVNVGSLDRLVRMSARYERNKLPPQTVPLVRIESDEECEMSNDDEDSGDDDERDDDYDEPSGNAFFKSERPGSDRHRFLINFYAHLGSVDEGQKNDKVRGQHACQVRTILEDIDPKGKDLVKMTESQGRAVWELWVAPHLEAGSFKPGTLVAYLGSLKKFLGFVLQSQKSRTSAKKAPSLKTETVQIFEEIVQKITGWRRTILNQSAGQQNEHYLEECEQRLTKEDFRAFLTSPVIAEAEALFRSSCNRYGLQEFTRARDYLVTRLALSCGTRPKPLETATLQHFRDACRDRHFKNCYVMLVPRHKRQIEGPAIIAMDDRLYEYIKIYIRDIRPTVCTSSNEEHLFLKMDGRPFKSGTIGNRVTILWRQTCIRPDMRVTCTDFRKSFVTMVEEANKDERYKTGRVCLEDNDLRKLLSHSQKTARLWYMRENLTSVGARAHNALQVIREGLQPCTNQESNSTHTKDEIRGEPGHETQYYSDEAEAHDPNEQASETVDPASSSPGQPRFITIHSTSSSSGLNKNQQTPMPPVGSSTSGRLAPVASLSDTRSRSRRFSPSDSSVITNYVISFKNQHRRCPNREEILRAFRIEKTLIDILRREGQTRCVIKVRNVYSAL